MVATYAMATLGQPDEFGYRWVPFLMLAMPWHAFIEHFFDWNSLLGAFPASVLNGGILFMVRTAIRKPPVPTKMMGYDQSLK